MIESFAVLPTIALVELSAWLVGGLTDERDLARIPEPEPKPTADPEQELLRAGHSELLSEGSLGSDGCCDCICAAPSFTNAGCAGALNDMVFIAARLTSATSSGDACSKGGGRPTRFAAGDDTAAGASGGCRWSTSIASPSDSANPATGTCTSRSPTDTGTVSEVMSLPCPDALGIVSTSIGSGVGLTVLMLRLRLRLPLLLSELTVPERPWNSDAACASAVS